MAGVEISALPAAASVLETDLFATVAAVGPTTQKATMTQVATALGIDISPTNSAAFTVSLYSLTANNAQSMLNLAGTWNTTGTPTAIKLVITNTASNAASLLMDLQTLVGGSQWKVNTLGFVTQTGSLNLPNGSVGTPSVNFGDATTGFYRSSANTIAISYSGVDRFRFDASGAWVNDNAGTVSFGGGRDLMLARDGAGIFAQRNAANVQIFRLYGTFTDAANYERLTLTTQAAATILIDSEAAGTGTRRQQITQNLVTRLNNGESSASIITDTVS